MKDNRRVLVFLLLAVIVVGGLAYWLGVPQVIRGAVTGGTSEASDSTPYGESISISLGSSSETSGAASMAENLVPASWLASYQDEDSQDVYEVNSTYKEQETVTISYDLDVTYSNVGTIKATVKIDAIDKGTPANHNEYTLANEKSLSGASPINDDGSTAPSISTHLTDIGGSTTDEEVQYKIYCQVTATGTVSGDTLTATISYTPFGTLHYEQSSESSAADVVPSINVTSWLDEALGLPGETIMTALAAMTVVATVIIVRRNR